MSAVKKTQGTSAPRSANTRKVGLGKKSLLSPVDAYLATVPAKPRIALERLRKIIRSVVPGAEETISYKIPTFKLPGPLVGYAAFTNHCSFFLMSTTVIEAHAEELASYKTSKGTVHFTPDRPLPVALVKKLVKARIAENAARKKR